MGEYLKKTQQIVRCLYLQLKETLGIEKVDVKFGFVAYRDHPPEENSYLVKCCDLCEVDDAISYIRSLDAAGGGDIPEAVMDGLMAAVQGITWRKGSGAPPTRYIIHLLDAPPHGDLYTGADAPIMSRSFMWTKGCPCGITIEKIAGLMLQKEIQYRFLKIGHQLESTAQIFQSHIKRNFRCLTVTSPQNLDLIVTDMILKEVQPEDIE